jgi:signal peptidase I
MDNAGNLKMQETPPEPPKPAAPRRGFFNRHFYWFVRISDVVRQFWIVVILAVWGTICYFLISHFVFISVEVDGQSMVPTLEDSGHYWLNRFAYLASDPHRLDIVALKDPRDNVLIVKRIIAMPGQSIYFHAGKVYVDGALLKEPYLMEKTYTFADETRSGDKFTSVPNDEYFVLGDNRNYSTDSRVFGPVARKNILGKLIE